MNAQKGILIVALPRRGTLAPAAYALVAAGRGLAEALKEPLAAVVIGDKAASCAKDLAERGATTVYTIENPILAAFNDELFARAVAALATQKGFGKILIASSVSGRSLAARLAVLLKAGLDADVTALAADAATAGMTATRSTYSGNVVATVSFKTAIQVATLAPMIFPRAEKAGAAGAVEAFAFDPGASRIEAVSFTPEESNEIDLGAAERVVSGGRGLGNADGFKIIREFAATIGAAVGASRAVVDSGWIAYRHQVGLTGKAVRPKLYVACGISGQIQHLAGMSSSGTIVAINTDPAAPMMQLASIAVEADLNEIIPLIIAEVKKRKGG